ncbi:putative sterile alpha motif/pointed domain-containing protein [Rosa chinensis]|uniref:Putative sterile alpha motif/pointed domain-containing protein n=1 Tax=Rosa chinensis TaxID=74649 RepID=A0A2P6R041_ROSCH|nr:putative sterile alpha motif/pointed domain-containing protein [Rosa chinensis]
MAAELQPLEATIPAGPTATATSTPSPLITPTATAAIATTTAAAAATATALHSGENPGPQFQLGQKRQRRPSVRLGEIGDQPAATVSIDSHMRRAKYPWKLPKDSSKSVKARSITNLVNGHDSTEIDDRNQNGDGGFEFGSRKIKSKRAATTKRVRSNWISNSKIDEGGDSREEGEGWMSADPDRDSPVRDESPVQSAENEAHNWEEQRRVGGNNWGRGSESRENDALGLSRYTPVFEIHEVDDEVLPMLTLEDLKDMGINAVGSRRKMYSAIQKLRKGFS